MNLCELSLRTTVIVIVLCAIGMSVTVVGTTTAQSADIVVGGDGSGDFTTIQQAVDRAGAGDTITVEPGTYEQPVNVYKDVTIQAPDGATLTNTSQVSSDAAFSLYADATVSGFTLTDWRWGINGGGSSAEWTVRNLTILRSYQGITGYDSSGDWTVEDTTIRDARVDGITVQLVSGSPTIENTSVSTADDGIDGEGLTGHVTLDGVDIRNISDDGIDAENMEGRLTLRETAIQNATTGNGLVVTNTPGEVVIRNTSIETVENGIYAWESAVEVRSSNLTVTDTTSDGIDGGATTGEWAIQAGAFRDIGGTAIDLSGAEGQWEIHESILTAEGTAVDATDASRTVDAADNYWGAADGPGGEFNGSGGDARGNLRVTPYYADQSAVASTQSVESSSQSGGGIPVESVVAAIGLGIVLIGYTAHRRRGTQNAGSIQPSPSPTESSEESTEKTAESTAATEQSQSDGSTGVAELRADAEARRETAMTAEENDAFGKAVDAYRDAIEAYTTIEDQLSPTATETREEITAAREATREDLAAVQSIHESRIQIRDVLTPAERSFQEAIVAAVQGDQTIARIRFRQARDSFEEATELINDSNDDVLSTPIEVTIQPDRQLSSTTLTELPAIPDSVATALSDSEIKTIADFEVGDESPWTPLTVEKLVASGKISESMATTLTLLSWYDNEGSSQFETRAIVAQREQQADYGFAQY